MMCLRVTLSCCYYRACPATVEAPLRTLPAQAGGHLGPAPPVRVQRLRTPLPPRPVPVLGLRLPRHQGTLHIIEVYQTPGGELAFAATNCSARDFK